MNSQQKQQQHHGATPEIVIDPEFETDKDGNFHHQHQHHHRHHHQQQLQQLNTPNMLMLDRSSPVGDYSGTRYLGYKVNIDDADSGIHELNNEGPATTNGNHHRRGPDNGSHGNYQKTVQDPELDLHCLLPNPVRSVMPSPSSNRTLSLRGHGSGHQLIRKAVSRRSPSLGTTARSYSVNCLPAELDDIRTEFKGSTALCRNCSTRNYFKNEPAIARSDFERGCPYPVDYGVGPGDAIHTQQQQQKSFRGDPGTPSVHHHHTDNMCRNSHTSQVLQRDKASQGGPTSYMVRIEQRFCKINVLLLVMKMLLGSTMSGLGLYLFRVSPSMRIQDCCFWAAIPLFLSGILDTTLLTTLGFREKKKVVLFILAVCGLLSLLCSGLCLISSIFSGYHGGWISSHSDNCFPDGLDDLGPGPRAPLVFTPCCFNNMTALSIANSASAPNAAPSSTTTPVSREACICKDPGEANKVTGTYQNLNCRYVFSALKDYLILQCALMAIGSGVSMWLLQITSTRFFDIVARGCSGGGNHQSRAPSAESRITSNISSTSSSHNSASSSAASSTKNATGIRQENRFCDRQSPIIPVKMLRVSPVPSHQRGPPSPWTH